jgi:hypothetical protein
MAEVRLSDEERAKLIVARHGELDTVWQQYRALWQDVVDFCNLRAYNLDGTFQDGKKVGEKVFNSEANLSARDWADGMYGYMMNPAIEWFKLRLRPYSIMDNRVVKEWLEAVEEHFYMQLSRSNFYEQMPDFFLDGGTIGTATLYSEEDRQNSNTVWSKLHPGEVRISENKFGKVDAFYRKFKLPLRKVVQRFKLDTLDTATQTAWQQAQENKGNIEQQYEFIHAIYPRDNIQFYFDGKGYAPKPDAMNMPFASCYVQLGSPYKIVQESGYQQFPLAVWRCRKTGNEVYGRSPASDAIVDILTANQMSKTLINAAHMAVDPPYAVKQSMRGKVRITPRGRTYYQNEDEVPKPLLDKLNYPVGVDREDRIQGMIKRHFMVEFFTLLSQAAMEGRQLTVPQVMEMQGEKAVMLGTIIGRLTSEVFDPVIDRLWAIELEAGRLPPPPRILVEQFGGAPVEVDYMGPLAQAQKRLFKTSGITATLESALPVMKIYPETMDLLDGDEAVRQIAKANGAPANLLRDPEQVQKVRDQRAQQQAAQAKLAMMSQAADKVPALSKAPEPGSPMEGMMGGGEGA